MHINNVALTLQNVVFYFIQGSSGPAKLSILTEVNDVIGSGHKTVDDLITQLRFKRLNNVNTEETLDEEREIEIEEDNSDVEIQIQGISAMKLVSPN